MDTKELVKALRAMPRCQCAESSETFPDKITDEAAGHIERLERERDDLQAEVDEANTELSLVIMALPVGSRQYPTHERVATLRARVARLEEGDREWGRLHQMVIEERAAALLRIERLEDVLRATREAFIVDKAEDGRVQGVSYYSDALRPLIGRLDAALKEEQP